MTVVTGLDVAGCGPAREVVGEALRQASAHLARQVAPLHQSAEEQLHELRASVAGVACAVRLLVRPDSGLTGSRKRRLETMLESELSRLERLLFPSEERKPTGVVVADVIAPVILARRLAGETIEWHTSGGTALCVGDHLAEAVNILLANAAQHASGSRVRVEVTELGEEVQVLVSDEGPGIPPALMERIFEAGFRGGDSGGQGIGLHLARRLTAAQGGSLRVAHRPGPGAAFVLTLPKFVCSSS